MSAAGVRDSTSETSAGVDRGKSLEAAESAMVAEMVREGAVKRRLKRRPPARLPSRAA